ncbi:MAG: hypothetical protein JWO36_2933 [Myxococcales bacterium]|nr:hypothetical protein [Myxococcales bacterium]
MTTTSRLMFALAGVLGSVAACGGTTKHTMTMQEMIAADPLPLAKGAKWEYSVTLKRFDPETEKEVTKSMSWTTEVLDAKEANGITAYRVKGWPTDISDADGTPVPTERTLLRSGNNFLFGKTSEPTIDGAEGWFSWPVMEGQKICPSNESVYCWQVAAVTNGYTLSYLTGPDERTYELEPGTGVSRYHYAHHGTTNEVDAKLVSYTKGH